MSEPITSRVTIHPSWFLLKSSKNLIHCSRGISLVCMFYLLRKNVPYVVLCARACGGLIIGAFNCRQAAWLPCSRRLDNLRYMARRLFIVSGRRRIDDMNDPSENRSRFEHSDPGHTPLRNAHDQHGTFGSIEHLT